MKSTLKIHLGLIFLTFLLSFYVSGQNEGNPKKYPGRKYPPTEINEAGNIGSNTDAPAGSISVAENATFNAMTPAQLVQNVLVTGCLTASNVRFGYYVKSGSNWTWTNHTWSATAGDRQLAYFNKASSTFPMNEGLVLTTGKASSAMGPNTVGNKSDQMVSAASDRDLATITGMTMHDASILEFDFVPAGNTVEFTYVFTSEEYIEYCETEYNDAFGFFLSGPGISGTYSNNAVNLAVIPGNIPVSINTIHPAGTNVNNVTFPAENAQYYIDNPANSVTMQYDGGTVVLTATYTVVPCSTYRIKMAVADASDQKWDAGVFLGAKSFNSENLILTNFGNFIENQNNVFEGCSNYFRIERTNPDLSQPLTVNLLISGTANNGTDIQTTGNLPFPTTVTIPANTPYLDIPYTAIADGISDNDETFIISTPTPCPCGPNVVYVTQTIHIYEQVAISSITANNAQCNGQSNGTIAVNATGGSGSYLYSINNGTTWQSLNTFTGLATGTYTILVKDPGSCYPNATGTATIGNPAPIVANAGPDVTICAGTSTQLFGGGGVLYNWSPAAGLNFTNVANPIASPTVTTEYTLTVTSAAGLCASTDKVIVTVLPSVVAPVSASVDRQILCNNDNGNIILTATGGSGTTLEWFSGACGGTLIGTGNNLSVASPSVSTSYFARWTSSCGSSPCIQLDVNVPTALNATITAGNILCHGGSTTLTVNATGGTGNLQYSLNGGTYQSSNTFTVNVSGSPYIVAVKDENNCTILTNSLNLTEPTPITIFAPVISNVSCTGGNDGQVVVAASGGTGIISFTISPNTGTQSSSGTFTNLTAQTYTITAQDENGCTETTTAVVGTSTDNLPPIIVSCAPPQSAGVNANCQAVVPDFMANVSATDNCTATSALTITQSPPAGTLVSVGITNITITVKDAANNSVACNTTFTVSDITAPVIISCAPPQSADANANCQAVVPNFNVSVTATDNCTAASALTITQSPIAGTLVSTGITNVTITVKDAANNTATCNTTFTVTDNTAPLILNCAPPQSANANSNCQAILPDFTPNVNATDNCTSTPELTITQSPAAGTVVSTGVTDVTLTVKDAANNTSSCSTTFTVADNTSPVVVSCAPPQSANADANCQAVVPDFTTSVTATDNCTASPALTIIQSPAAGTLVSTGVTNITITVKDANNNVATCITTLTVKDITAPVIVNCAPQLTANANANCQAVVPDFTPYVNATDNCTASQALSITQSPSPGTLVSTGITNVTISVIDGSNNTVTCNTTFTVTDNTPPVIVNCAPAQSAIANASCQAVVPNFTVTANDNCTGASALVITQVPAAGSLVLTGVTNVSITVRDEANNIATCNTTFTVTDNQNPTISGPANVTVNADPGVCFATSVNLGTPETGDNCGVASVTNNAPTQFPVGATNVTWTVTDLGGLTATSLQVVTVIDTQPPTIICPATITVNADPGSTFATGVNLGTPVTDDNCGVASVTNNAPSQFPVGSTIVTWTVTDIHGLSTTCTQTVVVSDSQSPTLSCPPTIIVNCLNEVPPPYVNMAEYLAAGGTVTDNDGINPASFALLSQTSNGLSCPEVITRVYTIADINNNFGTCSQLIIVDDTISPLFTNFPANITVSCNDVPETATIGTDVTASDNCDPNVIINFESEVRTNGTCNGTYSIARTWKATDDCGNFTTKTQTINVQDNTAPVISALPATSTIDCPATPVFVTTTASDACGSDFTLTFNDVTTPGLCAGSYSVTRTWTATDACGNISTANQTINVRDVTAPVIDPLPAASTINCPANIVFAQATATDACNENPVLTFVDVAIPGICAGSYSVTRTWTATDACGNSSTASQTINIQDNTAPLINDLPAVSTISCPSVPVFTQALATDACDENPSLTYSDVTTPGLCAGSYSVTRTWTAADACGNVSTSSQTINVQDNTAPVITALPATSTINCPATPVFATATASDACGSAFTLTFNDVTTPGLCAGSYSVTRTWTATDACGNVSTAAQTINVQDNTAPVIAALPVTSTINCPATPVFATATASDACGSAFTLTFNDVTTPGLCAGSYSVTRTWTATDACGNVSTAAQTINVQDNTAPVITALPATSTINCPATPVFATATASDACGSAFTLTFNDVTTPGLCAGSYSVTRTWTATDACGNVSTAAQTINIQDNTAPVIAALPATSTINCPATPVFAIATASDACGSAFTLTFNDVTTPGLCAGSYSVTRTWTATDACGNVSTAAQTINVQDNTAPVIAALPATSTINCPATPVFATATASDACGSAFTLTFNDVTTPGLCAGSYSVTRTWTATDACGNVSTAAQTINVQDNTAPVIAALPVTSTINCPATPVFATATASDACGSAFTLTFNDVTTPGLCAGSYSVTRTWTASDACGNVSTAAQTINVQDNTAPVIAALPATSTINCPATPVFATATASDACGSAFTLTFNDVTTSGLCAGSYSVTRTWTATDDCGNVSTATQTINVQDNTAPVIAALPATSTINCPATPAFATATALDACGSAFTLTFNDVTTPGLCAGSYSVTRTWTATDACGNVSTAAQTINVQDNTAPVIAALPATSTINCPATPIFATATASDACGSAFTLTFNDVTTSGLCAGSYSVTRTWTATDDCGNVSTATQTINVQDNTAPVIAALPATSTINCPATPVFATATALDACGSAFTLTFNDVTTPGLCAGSYSVTRTWTATDACGNVSTAAQTINVQDNTAPVIAALPATSTINCPATPVFATATALDACGSAFTLTFNDVTTPGLCAGSYSVTRTWTATDACGNVSTAAQTINIQDNTAPVIAALPPTSTINCPATPVFATATASDACGSAFTLTFNDVTTPGLCAGSYSLTRTWTATDACGNVSTAAQTINIQDNTAPVIAALPATSTINCPATPVFATATASDACGSAFTLTFNDVTTPGLCAGSYSVTRTWTATDACGNVSTAAQTINVQDNTAPVIATLPATSTINCPATPDFATATASDACGSTFTLTFNDVTTPDLCAGSYSVTRTWTATDACGNVSTAAQTINVQDNTAPVIAALPATSTINCPATPVFATATASDACGSAFTLTFNDVTTPGLCAGSYSMTRTWTATDACGNVSTATQTINVQDNTAPVIAALPATSTINCPATPVFATATASDACGSAFTLTFNDVTTPGLCAGSYSVTRTWTATDACGNVSTAAQTINVQDNTAPVLTCAANITVNNDPGICGATVTVPQPSAIETCSSVTFTNSINGTSNASGLYPVGTTTINWLASDACGNTSTCSMSVTVIDSESPVIVCPSDILICSTEQVNLGSATATDNCGIAIVVNNAPSIFVPGTTLVVWTATDIHGNTSTCTQNVVITPMVTASAGLDDIVCEGQSYVVNTASAQNYSSLSWTTTGQGTILNASTIHPTYIPTNGETGNIYLKLKAFGIAPCASTEDQMLLTILPAPIAVAGPDENICENQTFSTTNAFAGYTGSILWSTSGTGTFNDPTLIVTTYSPSASDISNGSVILTLTSSGTPPCSNVSDNLILTINKATLANAGNDASTCQNIPYHVSDANAQNYSSILWTHNGSGILTGANTLSPTYTPATGETGIISLTLTAGGIEPCGNAVDVKLLTINSTPTATAGDDFVSCDAAPVMLTSAMVTGALSVQWSSTGTGTFDNASLVNATYTPSADDVINGSVTLTLNVIGNPPCGNASDQVLVTLVPAAHVFAGESTIICSSNPYTINDATVSGSTSINWTHDGAGILENAATIHPTYIPATGESGIVHLFLIASGQSPCGLATDSLTLQVIPGATANAGNDILSCLSVPVQLNAVQVTNYTSVEWSTSGTGTFDNTTILNPVYMPSQADVSLGFVEITLLAKGTTPCGNAADVVRVDFVQAPTAFAGPDEVVCAVVPFTLSAATAANYSSVLWTHNGKGSLSDPTALNPVYTPTSEDIGTVEFTLTAYGMPTCGNLVSDLIKVSINPAIQVNAGPDETIASGTSTTLNGSVSGGSGSFTYNWSPEELLVDNSVLNPTTQILSSETIFTLHVMDMNSGCTQNDEVLINMGGIIRPIARNDYDTTGLNTPTLVNVLANDSDPIGLGLTVSITNNPKHGNASVNEDGSVNYEPINNFTGNDTLTYMICDFGTPSKCATAIVVITIFPIREPIEIYNLVTPNGDGRNDYWYIRGIDEYPDNQVSIFNRWGDKIVDYSSYNNTDNRWNGANDKNEILPSGVYFYIIKIKDMQPFTGWVYVRGKGDK